MNIKPATSPITVTLPDGSTAISSHVGTLNWPSLPDAARTAHIFPSFPNSLVSIGLLCDAGITAIYTSDKVELKVNDTLIATGYRDSLTRLWMVDLISPNINSNHMQPAPAIVPVAASTTSSSLTKFTAARIASFYHAALFSPTLATLIEAVQRGYLSLPGFSVDFIRKHLTIPAATSKGHLNQTRSGQRSTKHTEIYDETTDDWYPLPRERISRQSAIITRVVRMYNPPGRLHVDLAGRFPITARSGAQYMLVMYNEDTNYIHIETMKSRKSSEYVLAYSSGIQFWTTHGIDPQVIRLDNETSTELEEYCRQLQPPVHIQYVPPNNHRANRAERAIRTWKDHFIAGLATTDPNFPLEAWDELIPQAELTLNLLRSSAVTNKISAWQEVHGIYSFDKTPIAPPGLPIVCHEKPKTQRSSWAPHGLDGFYLGPALQHYRCYKVWIKSTRSTRITDTLAWHPAPHHHLPGASPIDDIISLLAQLQETLTTIATQPPSLPQQRQPIDRFVPAITKAINALSSAFPAAELGTSKGDDATLLCPTVLATPSIAPLQPSDQSPTIASLTEPQSDPPTQQHTPPTTDSSSPSSNDRPVRNKQTPTYLHDYIAAAASMQDTYALNDNNKPLRYADTRKGSDRDLWRKEESTELRRLLRDTNTMHFISQSDKPSNRIASYYNPQVKVKVKDGVTIRRVRGTYGGNLSDYAGDRSSHTADLQTFKLLLNAVISEDVNFMTADIKDFYLGSTLESPEYMFLRRDQVPEDIQLEFKDSIHWDNNNRAMVKITKGIYGLPQAGRLAQLKLTSLLAKHGYFPTPHTPCLFKHQTLPIAFTLVVDDFAIKFKNQSDAEHLLAAIRQEYDVTVDWTGAKYLGMTITFSIHDGIRQVTLSMPGYVAAALKRFNISTPSRPTRAPAIYTPPVYGKHVQYANDDLNLPKLDPQRTKFIQEVIGVFLYYSRAVDSTMFTTINKLATRQSYPTLSLYNDIHHFLKYAASYPNGHVTFYPSNMILMVHSDASYLSESKARSRAGGFHYLPRKSSDLSSSSSQNNLTQTINGAIDVISCIIPTVVSAASEAEYAALFLNGQNCSGLRLILDDLGYPQPATIIISDNTTAIGVANRTTKIKKSKAMDMRYHWIRDRVQQGQFKVIWQPGGTNLADYFTKIHPVHHYESMRDVYTNGSYSANLKLIFPTSK